MVTTAPTWRDERRRDRLAQAEIDERRETARAQLRIEERRAKAEAHAEELLARSEARERARKLRAESWAACGAWLERHVLGLLFAPVIGVPGALAWTGMAAYGAVLWGPLGHILPALSEGGTWVFAAATTITLHRHPDRPLWHLRVGTAAFAALGAALNFAHGVTTQAGWHGIVNGAVYAVVSVSGVTAHQLITAGPRRSRLDRARARKERAEARLERAVGRAALRAAVAVVDNDGSTRLVFTTGQFAVKRRWFGRISLETVPDTTPADKGDSGQGGDDRQDTDTGDGHQDGHDDGHGDTDDGHQDGQSDTGSGHQDGHDGHDDGQGDSGHDDGHGDTDDGHDDDQPDKDSGQAMSTAEAKRKVIDELARNPKLTDEELAEIVGRSARTVRRYRTDTREAANDGAAQN